ncbi:transposase [Candidatus Margulisiibacteriota bacterium]
MSKQYDEDFKKEAVRLIIENGRALKQVARELGVNSWTLRDWKKKYGTETQKDLIKNGVIQLSPEEELKLLKRELLDVTEERDILKKAIAIFSKKPKRNMNL